MKLDLVTMLGWLDLCGGQDNPKNPMDFVWGFQGDGITTEFPGQASTRQNQSYQSAYVHSIAHSSIDRILRQL